MKGNVLDLAVAVIIGAAFGQIVNALVESVLMPAISGRQHLQLRQFRAGHLLNASIAGVLLTAIVNFLC